MPLPFYQEYFHVTYSPRGTFSLVLYLFFVMLIGVSSMLICWYTTEFWAYSVVDCGKAKATFDDACGLHVVTVKGKEFFWTCSEVFNTEFLMTTHVFIQPFLSIFDDGGQSMEILLSVPIGDVSARLYTNPEDLPINTSLDAVESIAFIPRLRYVANGNHHSVSMEAAPQIRYERSRAYWPDGVDNTAQSFSGGPVCVHQEYLVRYSSADYRAKSTTTTCESGMPESVSAILSEFYSFTSACSNPLHALHTDKTVERVGGLELWADDDSTRNIGEDLDQLNAFNWRITLQFPESCMPHTPQTGYSLKWGYIQFITIAWGFQFLYWQLRGIFATNGLIDLNAHYQGRLVGSRERITR